MFSQIIGGIVLIVIGSVEFIYAKQICAFFSKLDSAKVMQFDSWPTWMSSAWIWMMRITGIVIAFIGLLLIVKSL